MLREGIGTKAIIHESVHAIHHLFEHIGLRKDDDELEAYLVSWLREKIQMFMYGDGSYGENEAIAE